MNHEEWLQARKNGIGTSDAACILGLNPWKSNVALWEEKTGRRQPENLDGKPVVVYGKNAEAPLRDLFILDFPQYQMNYSEFGMIANLPGHPWLFATLDGDLTEISTNRKGVYEGKTTEIMRATQWAEWNGKLPQHYYCQLLHQLLATQYDFAVLKAQIKEHAYNTQNEPAATKIYIRHYTIELSDDGVKEGMEIMLEKECAFWECVQKDTPPPLILPPL